MISSSSLPILATVFPSGAALTGWMLLGVAVGWSLLSKRQNEAGRRLAWMWWWLLPAGVLLAFRWPLIWLPHELYPDESQLLAGALTLRHDPIFWRAVDGGTAGPLDYYALLPAAFSPGVTAYAVARITAVVLIWGGLVATGETVALLANRSIARIAVLPLLAFESLTTSPEFVHYSTELVPSFLLAVAVYGWARQAVRPSAKILWLTALLLGAVPFAKLQAAPIAAVLGFFLLLQEFNAGRRGNILPAMIAATLPLLLTLAVVTFTAQGENMLIPYFLQNLFYSEHGRQPAGLVLRQQWEQSTTNGYLALWLAGSAVLICIATARAGNVPRPLRRFGLLVAVLLATAVACILAPGRPYQHYLNLVTMPVGLLAGLALATGTTAANPRRIAWERFALGLFLLCGLIPPIALRVSGRPDPYAYYNNVVTAPSPAHLALVEKVRALTGPRESLGLWGWRSSLYVETGLRQATREAHTEFLFVTGPWQRYYLRRYLGDLQAARPPVFVDAVGPGNFRFQDRRWGHEVFPLLRDWVDQNYRSAGEWDGVRVYVRRDRLPAGVN